MSTKPSDSDRRTPARGVAVALAVSGFAGLAAVFALTDDPTSSQVAQAPQSTAPSSATAASAADAAGSAPATSDGASAPSGPLAKATVSGDSDMVIEPAGLATPLPGALPSPTPGAPAPTVAGTPIGTGAALNSSLGVGTTSPAAGGATGGPSARSAAAAPAPAGTSSTLSVASANNCPSSNLTPVTVAATYLSGKRMCGSSGGQRWQEFHAGSGALIDWRLGPGHPRDPRTTVGTWSANSNVLTYAYGGAQTYSFNVCVDNTNLSRVQQNQGSALLLVGLGNTAGQQIPVTVEPGEGACS